MKIIAIILGTSLIVLLGMNVNAALIGFNAADGSSASGSVTAVLGANFDPAQSDAGALGGAYITAETDGSSWYPGTGRVASYSITFTEAGSYDLYARVYVNGGSSDSLHYAKDFGDAPDNSDTGIGWRTVDGLSTDYPIEAYFWINLSEDTGSAGEGPGIVFNVATPGVQIFEIGGREAGLRIDALAFGTSSEMYTDAQLDASVVLLPLMIASRSPSPGSTILANSFPLSLGAVVIDGESSLDTNTVSLRLDGTNLTLDPGDVVKNALTTTVSHAVSSLPLGLHSVALIYGGTPPDAGPFTNTWSFTVSEPDPPPPICPRWAFEPWVWEDNANTQYSTTNLVAEYRAQNIPVGAIIIDSPWTTSYCSFDWDTSRYPDPTGMIASLRSDDVRVVLWTTGAQNITSVDTPQDKSPYFDYVVNNGYAVNGGSTYSWWKGTGVHIDFTNPEACDWFGERLSEMMDLGVDGWKVDQAESSAYLPYPVSTSIGSLSKEEFKPYYYGAVRDQTFMRNPESLIIARPFSHQDGYAASIDKCTIGWGGDYNGSFSGMKSQIADLYASAKAGYGTLAVEIGGYQSTVPSKETLIRYTQLGALMPVMENGGSNGGLAEHLPWYWDTETVDIYRYYATLHSELAPYLFSCSVDSHLQGGSIVKLVDSDVEQHKLGEQLFTALITGSWTNRDLTLPSDGAWIDYWNEDQLHASGASRNAVPAPLDIVPLYIKAGAIIPMNVTGNLTGHGDSTSTGRDTVMVYPFGFSSYTYHRAQGGGIEYDDVAIVMDEEAGTLSVTGSTNISYRFRIKSFAAPTDVNGADIWSYDAVNDYLIVDKLGDSFVLEFDGLEGYSIKAVNFELWQDIYGIAGAPFEGDSDANGMFDGAEYYLGSNPTNPLSPDHVLSWSSDYLAVTHPFNPLATGVTASVEWTADLLSSNWNTSGVTYTTNIIAKKIEATVGTSTTNQLFIRLNLVH